MDYSGLGSGFGEEDVSPFANQRGNPPPTRSDLASPLFGEDDDVLNPPTQYQPYSPTSPTTEDAPSHNPFGGMDDDAGFRSPGFAGINQRADQQQQHHDSSFNPEVQHQQQQHHDENAQPDSPQQQQHFHQHQEPHPGAPVSHEPQQQQQPQPPQQKPQRQLPQYRLQCKITALERTGRKDPIFKFDVHTNLPKFRTTQFRDVRRTHHEFEKLANHLLSSNPECIVPSVPAPSTSAGVGTEEDETRVKAYMQRWLNTVCSNEVLIRDEEMILFVESDFGYSPVNRRKQPATGVRRKVIKQFAPPPDDTPLLEQARPVVKAFYLGTMETGQKLDRVVKARRGLGLSESEFGHRMALMAANEAHPGMANAFRKLGRTLQSVGDYHAAQATAEATTLTDPLNYHSSDAFIVKEILTNRQILMRDLEAARKETRSKLQTAEVLKSKSAIRRDKVDEALQSLEEAKNAESHLDQKVRRVTGNLVNEQKAWFARTTADLRAAIRDHCLRQIEAERRTLATLEAVRPDIRAIDSSGGLSRLGRDAPPSTRRASMAASQGPKGDAWSGAPRAAGVVRGEFGVPKVTGTQTRIEEEIGDGEDDRLDARNAASRLAGSTF